MKSLVLFALAMAFVIASLSSQAQETYSVIGPHNATVHGSTIIAFGVPLSGTGSEIYWLQGGTDSACSTPAPGPTGHGFIDLVFDGESQPCMNAASYTTSGTVTVVSLGFTCSGPAQGILIFTEPNSSQGTLTLQFTYYHGRYGCYGQIVGGKLVY